MKLRVMTFNILHCCDYKRDRIDFDAFAEAILESGADIIGLNEVHGDGPDDEYTDQTGILAEKTGFYGYFAKAVDIEENCPFGNALLSRYPIVSCESIGIPDPEPKKYDGYYETRCLLRAKIDFASGTDVFVTHFGLNPDEQINAVETVNKYVSDSRCVLMGDFNIEPGNPLFRSLSGKVYDTYMPQNGNCYTFPSDAPDRKIDYIFVSRDIKVENSFVPGITVSDHRPFAADLEIG